MKFSCIIAFWMTQIVSAADVVSKPYHQYTAEELKAMSFVERIKLNDWRLELITLGFTMAFVVLYKVGDLYNQHLATKYLKSLASVFSSNFFQYGVGGQDLYVKDSSESFSSYASGRVNIAKVNISIKLKPRHNIFIWIIESVLSLFTESIPASQDKAEIVIVPSKEAQIDNFISAIVSKIDMNNHRKHNYYLSLTKTSDSSRLPESFVFMSEASEFQEKILTPELEEILSVQAASFIKFIAITDQSSEKPETVPACQPRLRIIISTNLTSNSGELKQLSEVLAAVFNLVDKLATKKITFRPEALKKIVRTRENEIAKILKVEEEAKQEEIAAEKAQLKRDERDRLRKLSREEQIKLEKKEMEKKQRKMQKKKRVKM